MGNEREKDLGKIEEKTITSEIKETKNPTQNKKRSNRQNLLGYTKNSDQEYQSHSNAAKDLRTWSESD